MIHALLGVSRAPFLPLSLLCALLGSTTGLAAGYPAPAGLTALACVAAVLAHASVNAFNEVADFRSGLDLHTARTPYSGGSGTLPGHPGSLRAAQVWAWCSLACVVAIGLFFLRLRGWPLAVFGVAGLLLVITYTPWVNRYPWLCLAAPGVGFGPVMVGGSCLAVTGFLPLLAWVGAVVVGLQVSGLLLANQQPDAVVDARFGRRHLAIAYGPAFARRVLAMLWLLPLPLLVAAVLAGGLPGLALLAAPPLLLAVANARQLRGLAVDAPFPQALLARNVLVCLATPLLLALALWRAVH